MTQLRPTSAAAVSVTLSLLALACQSANAQGGGDAPLAEAGTTAALMPMPTPSASSEMTPRVLPHDTAHRCPEGMTFVEGRYCPDVEHTCLEWMDPPGSRYAQFRCARYARPAKCKGERKVMRFCIETLEHREPDSELPMHKTSWTDASRICAASGGRLCTAAEWQFACEGEAMRPYPYGFERDSSACNVDVTSGLGRVGKLVDHRTPASAHPGCVSAFGVHDMAGNVDEWVTVEGKPPGTREVMKGSWWIPGRHACRSFQAHHGAHYGGTETGVRCCRDAG